MSYDDKPLLKKQKIYSLLDLALLLPASYSNSHLSKSLEVGKKHTLEAWVEEVHSRHGRLSVRFFLPQFSQDILGVFFRVTPYHFNTFKPKSTHYIQGKVETFNGILQISQPKAIKSIGKITPKYKSELKADEIRYLLDKYLSFEALVDEGLNEQEANALLSLHYPNSIESIMSEGKYHPQIVNTLKFIEAYNHIKKLSKKKRLYTPLGVLCGDITSFIEALPFKLTDEQQKVIAHIQEDLASSIKAARRMIVGDVGSGKTMVILASAMMAYPHKSILMAPTSILAQQIYQEAQKFLPQLKIALVMQGFKETQDLAKVDFIIGTHALLYREDLPQAYLVMVDEQHRFGSNQRQLLDAMMSSEEKRPHYLQFSATPIPRTQAMINSTIIDVSLITTTPFAKDIATQTIGKSDFKTLLSHIEEEIAKEHQVLIIYPLVEASDTIEYQSLDESLEFWQKRFESVYSTHGKDKNKESVLLEFREQGKILLATTVVEVGISLPRLTTIVIVGAERLGLASLHQLRGRVGRNGLKSWCYLYSNNLPNKRLSEFAKTTSGFDIASLDLKFRKSGDILDGKIQSGVPFRWLDLSSDEAIIAKAQNKLNNSYNLTLPFKCILNKIRVKCIRLGM
ncbi:MAG: ATP-dependent DNA helicase RecG [Campylobacterota bacterium]|nr:ATP-dependent DNA helicase RecG [Campylobacterota bacterium]